MSITFTTYESLKDTRPCRELMSRQSMYDFLVDPKQHEAQDSADQDDYSDGSSALMYEYRNQLREKEKAGLWSPALIRVAGKRCEDDVIAMSGFLYDCDYQPEGEIKRLEDMLKKQGISFLIYETWSSRRKPLQPESFHVWIPFHEKLTMNEARRNFYHKAKYNFAVRFHINYDVNAAGLSRGYFLPPIDTFYTCSDCLEANDQISAYDPVSGFIAI